MALGCMEVVQIFFHSQIKAMAVTLQQRLIVHDIVTIFILVFSLSFHFDAIHACMHTLHSYLMFIDGGLLFKLKSLDSSHGFRNIVKQLRVHVK